MSALQKLVVGFFLMLPIVAFSQMKEGEKTGEYLYRTYEKGGDTLRYRILYPNEFDETKEYPIFVFFHGMGERGTDNKTQLVHGSKLMKDSMDQYPAIVVFPQCPPTDYWANLYRPDEGGASRQFTFYYNEQPNPSLDMTIDVVNELLEQPYTDETRLYASGLSMGGMGCFEFAYRMNGRLAAALPICGGGPRKKAAEMTGAPFWIFHGIKDDVVNPRYSISMCKAIQQAGGKAKITLFPEANHNSWDPAFADPEYLSWTFAQRKKMAKK